MTNCSFLSYIRTIRHFVVSFTKKASGRNWGYFLNFGLRDDASPLEYRHQILEELVLRRAIRIRAVLCQRDHAERTLCQSVGYRFTAGIAVDNHTESIQKVNENSFFDQLWENVIKVDFFV